MTFTSVSWATMVKMPIDEFRALLKNNIDNHLEDINKEIEDFPTALLIACAEFLPEHIKALLEFGANPAQCNKYGNNALTLICTNDKISLSETLPIIELLIKYGVNNDPKNRLVPYLYFLKSKSDEDFKTCDSFLKKQNIPILENMGMFEFCILFSDNPQAAIHLIRNNDMTNLLLGKSETSNSIFIKDFKKYIQDRTYIFAILNNFIRTHKKDLFPTYQQFFHELLKINNPKINQKINMLVSKSLEHPTWSPYFNDFKSYIVKADLDCCFPESNRPKNKINI